MAAPTTPLPAGTPRTAAELADNRSRLARGELYYAFAPDLVAARRRCAEACHVFNQSSRLATRRQLVERWLAIVGGGGGGTGGTGGIDASNDGATVAVPPLPPAADTAEADEALLEAYPWVEMPVRMDYGIHVRLGEGVYVNANSTWIDTLPITVGARTLIGPNCAFYSGTHPLNPALRDGTRGPEYGKAITIGTDCWFGGNVVVLPGVTIGDGVTVGAGSVVTKDVPSRVVVAGNPARILKAIHADGSASAV